MERDEFDRKIRELRDAVYLETLKDAPKELHQHLRKEYNDCDVEELVDTIRDLILDSMGS